MKQINDAFGHNEGSQAIAGAAEVLRRTFRESDVIARIGGDEFAVLAADATADEIKGITKRLRENIRSYNDQCKQRYALSLSLGAVCAPADTDLPIEELVARADKAMYEHKHRREKPPLAQTLVA